MTDKSSMGKVGQMVLLDYMNDLIYSGYFSIREKVMTPSHSEFHKLPLQKVSHDWSNKQKASKLSG